MRIRTIVNSLILLQLMSLLLFVSAIYANERYKITSVSYDLTDDNDFSGDVTHHYDPQENIEFKIKNISKKPFSFEQAKYFAVKNNDKSIYRLECTSFSNPNISAKTYLSNPNDVITITCIAPLNLKDLDGFFIELSKERRIYFEYEELSNWKTLWRKFQEAIGIKKNRDNKYPPEEGWIKGVTSSGNVYYYKKDPEKNDIVNTPSNKK